MKRHILLGFVSFFLFSIITIYLTFPLIFHLTDFASGEYVIAWILNWDIHALLQGNIFHIFNANIYYPFPTSLAYSDFFLPSSIIALVPFLLLHQPIVPSNITFLTSLCLLGFFTYLLAYYLTRNFFASLLSGLLVVCNPITLDKRVHLQMLSVEWIPLALLFFLHYCKGGKWRFLSLSLLFFVLQTYNSFLPGYFLVFAYTILSGVFYFKSPQIKQRLFQWKNVYAVLVALALIVPISIPYFTVSQKYAYVRTIRDAIHYAIQPEDLLIANDTSRLSSFTTFFKHDPSYPSYAEVQSSFLGIVFTILTLATILYALRQKKKNLILVSFILIGLLGFVLAFGPALHWARRTIHHPFPILLPYTLFYYVLPGFQGFRNSARFEMLLTLFLPIASGIMLTDILKKRSVMTKLFVYTLLILGTLIEFNFPLHFDHAPTFQEFPPVYQWIEKNTPATAVILEVPMYNWDNNPFGNNQEVMREYYSTMHFRKIVGGGSGFSPPPWQQLAIAMFNEFPSKKMLTTAKMLGVTYIIVHKKEYDILNKENWKSRNHGVESGDMVITRLNQSPQVKRVTTLGEDYIYSIR